MMKFKIFLLFISVVAGRPVKAQQIQLLTSGTASSLRGLSAVNDKTIWVSGSNGVVGRSVDSGHTWKWMTVKGFEKNDFRDIEAFDETTAVIMSIGTPAYMLRTADGGDTWKVVFENKTKGMFLDAMEFWNEMSGIVVGDPVNQRIYIARSFDGGMKWKEIPPANHPLADSGEAMFASSGTNVKKINQQEAVFVTGGTRSRLFIRDQKIDLPLLQGKETAGANSIAVKNSKMMIIVGGDFNSKDATEKNCVITSNGGKTFSIPQTPPHGYRSCVEYINKKNWISCGINGVDFSSDDGNNWTWISNEAFHVCKKAKAGKAVFLAGSGGRIGRLRHP